MDLVTALCHTPLKGLFHHWKGAQALAQLPKAVVDVQKTCGCGIWGHGFVVNMAVLGEYLELMIL